MSIFRSYFSKNNVLVDGNLANFSQNPVAEISYGTLNAQPSRLIFDIDFTNLLSNISSGNIKSENIVSHTLHLTNTIRYALEYLGKTSYDNTIQRATSFNLDFYNVSEDWDEGSGYDFVYQNIYPKLPEQASNWEERQTGVYWDLSGGSYVSGVTEILFNQRFETGSEDIQIDVTDYINQRIGLSGFTGYTGGTSYGLGVKFPDNLEFTETDYRQAVDFYVKKTHTYFEPYIETVIDDSIIDDRLYFFQDKTNSLFLYTKNITGITVNNVEIYDDSDNLVLTLSGTDIYNVKNGVYKINLNIDSTLYNDSVLFTDKWNLTINGKSQIFENQFYIIPLDYYYDFSSDNTINLNNYYFKFWGIQDNEYLKSGDVRKIKVTYKELYPTSNNYIPLNLEYRLYTTAGTKYEIDVIPYTPINRTSTGYEFNLDTSWLVPQDYYLQIRINNDSYFLDKEKIGFTIVSEGIK